MVSGQKNNNAVSLTTNPICGINRVSWQTHIPVGSRYYCCFFITLRFRKCPKPLCWSKSIYQAVEGQKRVKTCPSARPSSTLAGQEKQNDRRSPSYKSNNFNLSTNACCWVSGDSRRADHPRGDVIQDPTQLANPFYAHELPVGEVKVPLVLRPYQLFMCFLFLFFLSQNYAITDKSVTFSWWLLSYSFIFTLLKYSTLLSPQVRDFIITIIKISIQALRNTLKARPVF